MSVKPEDETSHQTKVTEAIVTSVCNDYEHFEGDQEVIEAENNIVQQILK